MKNSRHGAEHSSAMCLYQTNRTTSYCVLVRPHRKYRSFIVSEAVAKVSDAYWSGLSGETTEDQLCRLNLFPLEGHRLRGT